MKMQPRRKEAQEFVQNVVCHVGEAFEQNLVELMVSFKQWRLTQFVPAM